jgi:hypothetical protein
LRSFSSRGSSLAAPVCQTMTSTAPALSADLGAPVREDQVLDVEGEHLG